MDSAVERCKMAPSWLIATQLLNVQWQQNTEHATPTTNHASTGGSLRRHMYFSILCSAAAIAQ
jgi:hypothetical protein